MQLSDKELLKSVLYDDRHDAANARLDGELHAKKSAAQHRAELIAKEKAKKSRNKKFLRLVTPFVFALLIAATAIAYDYIVSWGRIHHNVEVAHIELGGKTPDAAKKYLDGRLEDYTSNPILIAYAALNEDGNETEGEAADEQESADGEEGTYWEFSSHEVGLSFDTTTAVEQAYAFGRSSNLFHSLRDRFMSYFELHTVDIAIEIDEELAYEGLEPVRSVTNVRPVDSRVVLKEGNFVVESGSDGIMLNEFELAVLMADAILARKSRVETPLEVYGRDIDDENAQHAADTANSAISSPVEVSYNDRNWTLDSADIARIIDFSRSDEFEEEDAAILQSLESTLTSGIVLEAYIPVEDVREHIVAGRLGADVGSAPVNARFSVSGERVTIRPSEIGSGVDSEQLALDLAAALVETDSDARSVEVTTNDIQPRRSTEDAEAMGVIERVSTYTTNFTTGNAPRNHNIQLIARMLDGTLVAPGEEFSFNGTTGNRTAADGFQAAGVIVGGEMTTAVGGGICQVSTTMFNTAMYAGVQVTQRINHSVFLSNYAPGRDAAVAAGGPDFRFKNTLDSYILISTSSTNSSVTISFFGTDPGFDVDIRTGNFSRNSYNTREIRDNTLTRGRRVVETPGQRGGTVNVYYTVSQGDTIVRQQTFTSTYRTVEEVVRVGTMRESSGSDNGNDSDDD
jgi:vancomycin resistance protein YoaR